MHQKISFFVTIIPKTELKQKIFGLEELQFVKNYLECTLAIVSILNLQSGLEFRCGLNLQKHGKTVAVTETILLEQFYILLFDINSLKSNTNFQTEKHKIPANVFCQV